MLRIVTGRAAALVPLLLTVTILVQALVLLMPGDPAVVIAGEAASPERIAAIRESLGLDQPFLGRYADWLRGAVVGEFGTSIGSSQPVSTLVWRALPVTLSLSLLASAIGAVFGLLLGSLAGMYRSTWVDDAVTTLSSVGLATPNFWIAIVLLSLFAVGGGILPVGGYVPLSEGVAEWAKHLLLPALAVSVPITSEVSRQTRSAFAASLEADHVLAARSRGYSPVRIVARHVIRLALVPAITVLGLQFARIFGSAVVVEQVFSLPGLGRLSIFAVFSRDLPLLQGIVVLSAAMVLLTNLVVDMVHAVVDPRIRVS